MIVLVIVIVLLVVAAALAGTMVLRRRALRRRFGAEYDQLAEQLGPRKAQAELSERQRRVAKLNIRPLSAERRAGYVREWTAVQESFIDGPGQAVEAAAGLVSAVAADRGYPAGDDDELLSDLSVYHANRLDGYRQAREVTRQASTAGTEELRQALLSYRALFRDLIGPEPEPAGVPSGAGSAEEAAPSVADGDEPAEADTLDDGRDAPADGGGTWVDSGRQDYRIITPTARKD